MIQQPEIGRKIAELRKAKGFTQEELVEKCNLNVRTLQRIESGEATPRPFTLKLIFEALDYSLNETGEDRNLELKRLEQFYLIFIDLFNLKTNTMKKVTILSIVLISITLGLFALVTEIEAQEKPVLIQEENKNNNLSDNLAKDGYFSCENSFQEDDEMIGYGVKFKKKGVSVNVQLMKLNTKTGKFNVGFVKGYFFSNKVEAYSSQAWIDEGILSYEAEDSLVYKEKDQIQLYGKAKLYSTKNEIIEANTIIIHLE